LALSKRKPTYSPSYTNDDGVGCMTDNVWRT